jgi:hypothetical protein
MSQEIKSEERRDRPPADVSPLPLADRIERFGRALAAAQLSELLSVSKIILYKLAKRGLIPCFRVGSCVRFDPRGGRLAQETMKEITEASR